MYSIRNLCLSPSILNATYEWFKAPRSKFYTLATFKSNDISSPNPLQNRMQNSTRRKVPHIVQGKYNSKINASRTSPISTNPHTPQQLSFWMKCVQLSWELASGASREYLL